MPKLDIDSALRPTPTSIYAEVNLTPRTPSLDPFRHSFNMSSERRGGDPDTVIAERSGTQLPPLQHNVFSRLLSQKTLDQQITDTARIGEIQALLANQIAQAKARTAHQEFKDRTKAADNYARDYFKHPRREEVA